MNYAEMVNAIKVIDAAYYKPCPAHGWNIPCHRCGFERLIEDDRIGLRMMLGRVGISVQNAVAAKMRQKVNAST